MTIIMVIAGLCSLDSAPALDQLECRAKLLTCFNEARTLDLSEAESIRFCFGE